MHELEVLSKLAGEIEGNGDRTPCGLGGVDQDGMSAAVLRHQGERELSMGHAVKRRGRSKERPPERAVLDVTPAGAFALPPAVAEHARHFAAGDHLRACRQEIFEERAAAVAIASDIDELGHLDSRTEHAVAASLWKGGAAAAYVIFQSETRVQPGIGPAPLSSHPCPVCWHCRTPWPTSSESGSERGWDV